MIHLLVIAGLDPSGGAGILADVRVAAEMGVRAVGVVTALTVQDTTGVRAVEPVAADVLAEQLAVLLADIEVHAVKIGMLGHARAAEVIARALAATAAPVVWDPILMPSRGGVSLLEGDARAATAVLLPEACLVTPNLDEAQALVGTRDAEAAARALVAAGARAALVKGGHAVGSQATDLLVDEGGVHTLASPRRDTGPLHGTGCVLSTAIACGLARGAPLRDAIAAAKSTLDAKLASPLEVGRGARVLV